MNKSKELDQFYTNPKIAKEIYYYLNEKFDLSKYTLLEPSAGEGSFSNLFHKNSVSIDIDPKQDYIKKADFLKKKFSFSEMVFTIGNPPFGKNSSLAVKFFNKAAIFSEYIAFIIPKTFKKISIQNKLDLNFHLLEEIELPNDAFIFNGRKYDVPCIFQIWEKRANKREILKNITHSSYFEFVDKNEADFAIRRVGVLAGKVLEDFDDYSSNSNYFIKSNISKNQLIKNLKEVFDELNETAKNSAGNPSLSKHELITILNTTFS